MAQKLLIGVDVGTAETCVSWAFLTPGDRDPSIQKVTNWQQNGQDYLPTEVAYKRRSLDEEPLCGWDSQNCNIEEYDKVICFKARLCKSEENHQLLDEVSGVNLDQDPLRPMIDILQFIRRYVLAHIARSYSLELESPNMETVWILGVPAAWGESEQDILLECAAKAGMMRVMRGSEPDAMAQTFLRHRVSLKPNVAYAFLDMGAGTVDSVNYVVGGVAPLRLRERGILRGRCCGSKFLTLRFVRYLQRRLVPVYSCRGKTLYVLKGDIVKAVQKFERFKRAFKGKESLSLTLKLKSIGAVRQLEITSNDFRKHVFDPVIDQIRDLIKDQLDLMGMEVLDDAKLAKEMRPNENWSPPEMKDIVVGGGFSQNDYLWERLKRAFPGYNIQRPPRITEQVSEGLVLLALQQGNRRQRQVQASYGIMTDYTDDEPAVNQPEIRSRREQDDPPAEPVIEWVLVNGHAISEVDLYSRSRYDICDLNSSRKRGDSEWKRRHDVVVCSAKIDRDTGHTKKSELQVDSNGRNYLKEPGDYDIFSVETNLLDIHDLGSFEPMTGQDGRCVKVPYHIDIEAAGDQLVCKWNYRGLDRPTCLEVPLHASDHQNPVLGSLLSRWTRVPVEHHNRNRKRAPGGLRSTREKNFKVTKSHQPSVRGQNRQRGTLPAKTPASKRARPSSSRKGVSSYNPARRKGLRSHDILRQAAAQELYTQVASLDMLSERSELVSDEDIVVNEHPPKARRSKRAPRPTRKVLGSDDSRFT